MATVISDDLLRRERSIAIMIYLFDQYRSKSALDYLRFFEEFAARAPRVDAHRIADHSAPPVKAEPRPAVEVAGTPEELKRLRLHHLRKLMAVLEDQRFRIEERLVELNGSGGNEHEASEIRCKLRENEDVRLQYLNEWKALAALDHVTPGAEPRHGAPLRIFVSSTTKDLGPHRNAVKDQIVRRDMLFRGMEHFGAFADHAPPATKIVEEVERADAYIGIFGVRYGSVDKATGLSMTELEFRTAEARKMPMLLYVIRDDAPIMVADVEPSPQGKEKLDALKAYIPTNYVTYQLLTA